MPAEARRKNIEKKQSVSQTIDQVVAIQTVQESSKSELSLGGRRPAKVWELRSKKIDSDFFFKNWLFSKIWPSKKGYWHLRRRNSLRVRCFSGLYDASPSRNIKFCVFDLDLERKTT